MRLIVHDNFKLGYACSKWAFKINMTFMRRKKSSAIKGMKYGMANAALFYCTPVIKKGLKIMYFICYILQLH